MGFLRLYLALCVVHGHADSPLFPWFVHDPRQAVQLFYITSGFYMALILSRKYHTVRQFYVSRWLRIFPSYYLVLFATILICVATGVLFGEWTLLAPYVSKPLDVNGRAGFLFAAGSNITIFGQDAVMFLGHATGRPLSVVSNFYNDPHPLYKYLLVPQCWSVGVEEIFYLCAPLINALRTRWLAAIASFSMAIRLTAYYMGLQHDPWTYRLAPFEIALFLMGVIAFRVHSRIKLRWSLPSLVGGVWYVPACLLLAVAFWYHARAVQFVGARIGLEYAKLLSYPVWAAGIVVLFSIFGPNRYDRSIGELSYPIYLTHIVIIVTLPLVMKVPESRLGLATGAASVIVSAAMYVWFIKPMDEWRQRFVARLFAATPAAPASVEI